MAAKRALAKFSILPVMALAVTVLALMASVESSKAQGTAIGKPWLFGEGIACDAGQLPWRTVWYGHFSGGQAHYERGAPQVDFVWEDRKLCFPSRRACLAWQRAEHRAFHRVAGYVSCLRLR
ncbi:MAG: hypothetical protein ACLP8A_05580 [Methylovirgula sp.]